MLTESLSRAQKVVVFGFSFTVIVLLVLVQVPLCAS